MRPAPPVAEQAGGVLLALAAAALAAFLLAYPMNRPDDPDVWFHLAAGRALWETGAYPQMGAFLWSYPADGPRAHPSWLFQALLYPLERAAGAAGLVVAKCLLVAAAFGLPFARGVTRRNFLPFSLALLVAYGGASGRFLIRPEVPAALLLGVQWALLEGRLTRGRLAALLGVQVLWVNLHWSAILGVALAGCAACADLLPRRVRLPAGWEPLRLHGDWRRVALLPLAVAAATLANPDFAQPFVEPFRYFFPRGFTLQLAELSSATAALGQPGMPAHVRWYFLTLAATAAALAFAAARGRLRLFHLAAAAAFALLSLSALRHALFFCVVAVPVIGGALRGPGGGGTPRPSAWRDAAAHLAVLALVTTLLINRVTGVPFLVPYPRPHEPFSAGVSPVLWPFAAARFVADAGLPERVFNDFNSGNFLAWALPGRRVYINGTFADAATEREYVGVTRRPEGWERFAAARGVGTAFFRLMPVVANGPLLGTLLASPSWALAFYDGTAAVFVRRAPDGGGAAAAPPVDLARELQAAIRESCRYTSGTDRVSLVPVWWEIVGLRRRQDLARVFRARAQFYVLAGRGDLAAVAARFAAELDGTS